MSNRERLIKLLQYLYQYTDDDHQVDTGELTLAVLGEDTPAKRKTIKEDISFLEAQEGFDIVIHKGSPDRFQWGTRQFDTAEVRLMMDGIAACNILTPKMSERLMDKMSQLVNVHERNKLTRHVYVQESLKTENVQVFYTIDKLISAIEMGRKVEFLYLKYEVDMAQHVKYDCGEPVLYSISPYGLVFENDRYYLVGYSDSKQAMNQFRIDRINDLMITGDEMYVDPDFCMKDYLQGTFKMYSGRKERVLFECKSDLMNTVFDHFGSDASVEQIDKDTFRLEACVQLSPPFYAWIFEAGNKVKILGPECVVEEYKESLREILNEYS